MSRRELSCGVFFGGELHGSGNVWGEMSGFSYSITSLRVVVMICAVLVNTQTDTQTDIF